MPGIFFLSPGGVFADPNQQAVQSNATITASGSSIFSGFGSKQLTLVVNIKASPTGTTPTLTFTIQEVDPGDLTTVIGGSVSTAALNSVTTATITLPVVMGSAVKVSWTVGGSSPSFTQVYATLSAKVDGPLVAQDANGADRSVIVDSSGRLIMAGAGTAGSPAGGVLSVQGVASGTALPISAASLPLPSGAAQEHTTAGSPHSVRLTDGAAFYDATKTGQLPSALVGSRLDVNNGAWLGSTAPTVGQKTMANSLPIAIASDQTAVPISGTVTANIGTSGSLALDATLSAQSLVDNAAFTDGTSRVVPAGFIFDEVAGTALTENDVAAARVDAKRAQVYVIEDTTTRGQRLTITASNAAKVDGSAVTQPISAASLPLPTGAATSANQTTVGSQTTKVNDGTNTAAVKAASTAAVAADPALVVAISPNNTPVLPSGAATSANQTNGTQKTQVVDGSGNVQPSLDVAARAGFVKVTDGTNTQPTGDAAARKIFVQPTDGTNLQAMFDVLTRAGFVKLTDGTNNVAVKAASTAAVAADPALVVSVSPNTAITVGISQQDVSSSGALGALNNAVSIACAGTAGVGMQLIAGTLIGTIVAELSTDGGTTWNTGYFFDQVSGVMSTSIVFASSNTAQVRALIIVGGISNVRVRVSAYTSGTATCNLRATTANDPSTAIRGTDGTNLRTVLLDTSGRIIVAPAGSNTTNGFSYGEVTTSATTNVAMRKTTYTEQASNAARSVSSASANDTSAGTGARTIKITYYDSTGAGPSTETLTMNGTTAVATVSTTICYIESITVLTVGSNGSNVGIISLFVNNSGGGGTIGTITAGDNRTFWGHHYVATGKTCSITSFTGNNNNSSNQTVFMIKAKDLSVAAAPEQQISDTLVDGGGVSQTTRNFGVALQVVGPARVTLFGAPGGSPTIINRASFDFYEQ